MPFYIHPDKVKTYGELFATAQEYTEYLKSIDPSVVKDIAPDISIPDVEFSEAMDGQDCGGHLNDTWTIGVEGRSY